MQDLAYQNVASFLSKGKSAAESDYAATLKSANKGNALDKLKIQLYNANGIGTGASIGGLQANSGLNFGGGGSNGLSGNILGGVRF